MDVEVLNFIICPDVTKIASVYVKYHNLVIHCDLVFHPQAKTAWIRMPETWVTKDKKVRSNEWVNQKKSDDFQKRVLKKIFEKHNLTHEKVGEIHKDNANRTPWTRKKAA